MIDPAAIHPTLEMFIAFFTILVFVAIAPVVALVGWFFWTLLWSLVTDVAPGKRSSQRRIR